MSTIEAKVPNAPCGVESKRGKGEGKGSYVVPNAPCGVESFNQRNEVK